MLWTRSVYITYLQTCQTDIAPGGWDDDTGKIFRDTRKQVETAFANIELMLKAAGGKGWSQVYSVTSYHVPLNGEVLEIMGEQFKKWMPDHKPIWSTVGVPRLGEDDLRTEIVVTAHDPEGAAAARKAAHHGRS